MKPIAVIQGIPRGKGNHNLNPGQEVEEERKIRRIRISVYAPVGVVGYPGSGRKTLAHRFGHMKETDVFNEEVPVKDLYGCHKLGELESGWLYRILLKLYIIDPENLRSRNPPLRLREWNEFCCMVIVFDITEKKTFHAVPQYLNILREDYFEIQENFFIVGNKSDLRRADETRHTQVTKRSASRMASLLGGTYYECSAKQNRDVRHLLFPIRKCALKVRYVID
ncbi:hypothetical protein AVEN_62990-1 [Araneus ventricosus]|uniref:small monomeric GTPase n=1 Tax=Araneus ventricosus TaxID=182803 RepID=A0A4Y2CU00_ARAVE|nr:hypothetical protein AVEN_62990-1 [Araneus ventricosus]